MNDDDLKKLWQQQPLRSPAADPQMLVAAMNKHATQFRRIIDARDIRETAAGVVVAVIFGFFYFSHAAPLSRLGDLIVIGSAFFIAWKLISTRRKHPPAPPGATTIESIRAEVDSVRAQSRLLGSVLWWYLLPVSIGLLLSTWGTLQVSDPASLPSMVSMGIVVTLAVIAVDVLIYRLNQKAVCTQFRPLEEQLEALLRSAETGEPVSKAHAAKLRPIVLSIESADIIKPVEFDVAFWQLAIFGVPGIVGIWCFWIPGAKLEVDAIKTAAPPGMVQTVFAGETNRYSAVALKIADLLNATDYVSIHKLYNEDMSRVFPLVKATNFYARIAALGRIKTLEGPTGDGFQGWTAFRFQGQYGELKMSLALDAEDKIAGIHFENVARIFADDRSFVRRFFSRQHLYWLPLFVVGGLLYSWMMQKTVKRAVGISALGIHLLKGQVLILWEEIIDVRPFKFLHIRNLRLIKDTGESTIMHWTPLERHLELRAAVEKFAPADHPIRNHLPLL